ncbi:hypothetical protein [Sphingobacterium thermophilum]|uniref:Glyoxalase/Bleomycin resistance-like N-terminal domain-containing protein n=1 Tax=Sphingobacterium thermophilum TaxID=768534 RepID=A0ABP8QY29_9SPHI
MALLNKIDETTNVVTWFEIPVAKIDRAQKFYKTILDIKMVRHVDEQEQAAFFPYTPQVIQAT